MVCKTCRGKIDDLSLYCTNCGEPSENHKKQFVIKDMLKKTDSTTPTAQLQLQIIGVVFAIIAIVFVINFKPMWISIAETAHWLKYIALNISMILLIPCIILPFRSKENGQAESPPLRSPNPHDNGRAESPPLQSLPLRIYLNLVHFTFYMCLYFFVLKVVCQGDPILNLVRFIMVLWGLAIAFPVPYLLLHTDDRVETVIKKAYIAGKYLRWKQFYLCVYLGIYNALTVFTLFVKLPQTLSYTWEVMARWYRQQNKFNLYDQKSDY